MIVIAEVGWLKSQ